jgi:N-acetyl-anhydromuramyl-L-alanine amidase AmpD
MKVTRPRKARPKMIVVHTTGGEGNGLRIYKTLVSRRLSVHFTIDYYGEIIQHADTNVVCFHAGAYNNDSIGIEIQNYLVEHTGSISSAKFPRPSYVDQVHGRSRKFLALTDAQLESSRALISSLCQIHGIPFKFPLTPDGKLYQTELPPEYLRQARGILGHFHLTHRKIDPATQIFHYLMQRGEAK